MYTLLTISKTRDSHDDDQSYTYEGLDVVDKDHVAEVIASQDRSRHIDNILLLVDEVSMNRGCSRYFDFYGIAVGIDELREIDKIVDAKIARKKEEERVRLEKQQREIKRMEESQEVQRMKRIAEKHGYKVVKDSVL